MGPNEAPAAIAHPLHSSTSTFEICGRTFDVEGRSVGIAATVGAESVPALLQMNKGCKDLNELGLIRFGTRAWASAVVPPSTLAGRATSSVGRAQGWVKGNPGKLGAMLGTVLTVGSLALSGQPGCNRDDDTCASG